MTITYHDNPEAIEPAQLTGFFAGWPCPPSADRHLAILKGSYKVWLAMDRDQCVGFINAISDGIYSAFIPLLEVLPAYQKSGIGSELVRRMVASLDGHYSIDVVCDDNVARFYDTHGFTRLMAMTKRSYDHQNASSEQGGELDAASRRQLPQTLAPRAGFAMASGIHRAREAAGTNLKAAIAIALDESLTALQESVVGLTDEQFWSFPLQHRNNIVTLVEHCIQCLDLYSCEAQGDDLTFEPEKRFDIFHFRPEELRPLMHDLPTVELEKQRIAQLRQHIVTVLERLGNDDLLAPRRGCWWFDENPGKTRSDAYMRCIWHTKAHVRQIWLLRGLLGVRDEHGWPHQHWA